MILLKINIIIYKYFNKYNLINFLYRLKRNKKSKKTCVDALLQKI